jgi:hypothetical protein
MAFSLQQLFPTQLFPRLLPAEQKEHPVGRMLLA